MATWDENYNNGSEYPVGTYRPIQSMIMDDSIKIIEGLIANLKTGGVGFRNHTLPIGFAHGTTWSEDLLFIEPETACVDTNLTVDFTLSTPKKFTGMSDSDIEEIWLTDHGGFANLNTTYPDYDHENASTNPDLQARAYKAAWLNNAYTMAYMNITNMNDNTTGTKSFSYLNSTIGKQFKLPRESQSNAMILSKTFGSYLSMAYDGDTGIYPNPFGVDSTMFADIATICSGAGQSDTANLTNIFAMCGLLRAPAQRTDNGSASIWERGSKWSSPMYVCASAVKATIKTVTFRTNGTGNLQALEVLDIKEKAYRDKSHMPLWGFEESGLDMRSISPVWGIVSSAYENYPNISTIRQPSLYMAGRSGSGTSLSLSSAPWWQSLPGSEFWAFAMSSVYEPSISAVSNAAVIADYSGLSSGSMLDKWRELSKTPQGASKVIDLIWTDLSAPAVVGTKGTLGHNNAGLANETAIPMVRPIVRRVKYRLRFGIPALILAMVLLLITLLAFSSALFGRSGLRNMERRLNQTSVGRAYSWMYWPQEDPLSLSSREWSWRLGNRLFDTNARSEQEIRAMAGTVMETSPFIEKSGMMKSGGPQTTVAAMP